MTGTEQVFERLPVASLPAWRGWSVAEIAGKPMLVSPYVTGPASVWEPGMPYRAACPAGAVAPCGCGCGVAAAMSLLQAWVFAVSAHPDVAGVPPDADVIGSVLGVIELAGTILCNRQTGELQGSAATILQLSVAFGYGRDRDDVAAGLEAVYGLPVDVIEDAEAWL